jgi:hypothetical protein
MVVYVAMKEILVPVVLVIMVVVQVQVIGIKMVHILLEAVAALLIRTQLYVQR